MAASKVDKFTVEQMVKVAHEANGLIASMAHRLGCERQTVYNYAKRYKTVETAIQQARIGIVDIAEAALMTKLIAGDTGAITFTLKTLGKSRGYVERQEITGKDGEAFGIEITRRAKSEN
jgi:hypothetical protein